VNEKSAWFILHRIRKAMATEHGHKLGGKGGAVEIYEGYIRPKRDRMHADRRAKSKLASKGGGRMGAAVMGMLERELRQVRAKVIPNIKHETLQTEILANVDRKSQIYADNFGSYDQPRWAGQDYIHKTV
jgi:ISXO2-like transposase domain